MSVLDILRLSLFTVVGGFILNILFESNVRHFIEAREWDTFLTRALVDVRSRRGFWFAFGLVLGATVMAWVLPEISMPKNSLSLALIGVGAILLVTGSYLLPATESRKTNVLAAEKDVVANIKTSLILQFFGDSRVPVAVGTPENIHYWYAQYSPSIEVQFADKDGSTLPGGKMRAGPMWSVFIVLEQSTKYQQVVSTFSNPGELPSTEFVGETDRSFIFRANGPMPAGVLEVRTTP